MVKSSQKKSADGESTIRRNQASNRITTDFVSELEDRTAKTGKSSFQKLNGKGYNVQRLSRTDVCVVVMFLLSVGSLAGIVWNVAHTGKITQLEQSIDKLIEIVSEVKYQMAELDRKLNAIPETAARTPALLNDVPRVTKTPAMDQSSTIAALTTSIDPAQTPLMTFSRSTKKTVLTTLSPPSAGESSTDFVMAFLPGADSLYSYHLYVLSNDNGTVELTGHGIDLDQTVFSVTSSGLVVKLPNKAAHFESGVKLKSFSIHSDVNVTVVGQVSNGEGYFMDTFIALPTKWLSTEYVVVSYEPVKDQKSQFLVLSTNDDTRVEIRLRFYDGGKQIDADTVVVRLGKGESYQYRHDHDLTGTVIRSNFRIAVYAGTSGADEKDRRCTSTLQEQLLPTVMWTTQYVVPGVPGKDKSYVARIVAKEYATNVTIHTKTSVLYIFLNKSGDLFDVEGGYQSMSVISSKVVAVIKITTGYCIYNNYWLPYMSIVPPIEKYLSSCRLYCVLYHNTFCYVDFILRSSSTGDFFLDNVAIGRKDKTRAPPPYINLWTMRVKVTGGAHHIKSTDSKKTFGAIVSNDEPMSRFGHTCGF